MGSSGVPDAKIRDWVIDEAGSCVSVWLGIFGESNELIPVSFSGVPRVPR